MKKFLMSGLVIGGILASSISLIGCSNTNPTNMSTNEIYAMGMVTATNFLFENSNKTNVSQLSTTLSDETKSTILTYIDMFGNALNNGGIHPIINDVQDTETNFANYSKKMTVTIDENSYIMYYNETIKGTETEYDENEINSETESILQGIILMNDNTYNVIGGREIETEEEHGKTETETEVTLIITQEEISVDKNQNLSSIDTRNFNNCVKIKQELENNEVCYEYTTRANGQEKTTSIGWENERGKEKLEIELEENNEETEYEITKLSENKFRIQHENGNQKFDGTMELENGEWKFRNRNGQEI